MCRLLLWLLLVCPLLTAAQNKLGAVVVDDPVALPLGGRTTPAKADALRQRVKVIHKTLRSNDPVLGDSAAPTRRKTEGFFMLRSEALGASVRAGYGYCLKPWLRFYGGLGLGYALSFSSGGNNLPSSVAALYDPAVEVPLFFRVLGMANRGVFRPYYLFELGYTYRYITGGEENRQTALFHETIRRYSAGSLALTAGLGSLLFRQKGLGLSAGIHVSYQAAWNMTEVSRVWLMPGQSLLSESSGLSHLWQPGIGLQLHF